MDQLLPLLVLPVCCGIAGRRHFPLERFGETLPAGRHHGRDEIGVTSASSHGGYAGIPLGFSRQTFAAERRWEQRYLKLAQPGNCRRYSRRITAEPHLAGTPGDRRLAQFIYDEFQRDGLNPELVEYKVLLSYPKQVVVELVAPVRIKLAIPEPEVRDDKATRTRDPLMQVPWNAYSPSADLTRPVVYANYGNPEDYDELEKLGVSVKGKIVLVRYFHGYRGGKSMEAQRRGAAGILIYSDPAEDGAARGKTYPQGPWGPLGHFQRGAVVYDFLVPGDPLTPGWASTDSARRIAKTDSQILPRIPMAPLSAADAHAIFSHLGGPLASKEWQGRLDTDYHIGDDATRVRLSLAIEDRVTPIWNVIGKITGAKEPAKLVILGNHHDAWVYGAVDPSSGTASMLETARCLGEMMRHGFHPRRTMVLASWDAEEYTLTGSTEWGEEHEEELKKHAVVCLNVDASTSGQNLSVSTVPAMLPAVIEAAQAVRDPLTGQSLYERWKVEQPRENIRSYAVRGASRGPVPFGILGGGSDFMVFLQHVGVPSLDMIFDGPYGVYHSIYDDFRWMASYGDPGFRYHAAMSRLWGLLALRFADADVVPLDYSIYAGELAAYLEGLGKSAPADFVRQEIDPLLEKCRQWHNAAERATDRIESLRTENRTGEGDGSVADQRGILNAAVISEERALLDPRGLPGRPWFRHLVYAPLPSYEAETVPGLREALAAANLDRARTQARALGDGIDRAVQALSVVP